jgi:hypothetical protein
LKGKKIHNIIIDKKFGKKIILWRKYSLLLFYSFTFLGYIASPKEKAKWVHLSLGIKWIKCAPMLQL